MESVVIQSVIAAFLAVLIISSGILLRKAGEPYKAGTFAIHKLSVIAVVVLIIIIYYRHLEIMNFRGTGFILFLLSDVLLVIAFVTGALLSFDRFSSIGLKLFHRFVSWTTFLFIPIIWLYCH